MEQLISVIIPVYKVESFLHRCVDSVIKQTYRNIEIILVNDGSPDNCPKICDEYAKLDDRIKVVHKQNGGLSSARNAGIEVAKGEYITFVDSDDFVSENFIESLYSAIVSSAADISVGDAVFVYSDKTPEERNEEIVFKSYSPFEAVRAMLLQEPFSNSACAKLFSKKFFANRRFTNGILYEDFDIIFPIVFESEKVVFNSAAEYYYYQNPQSIMHEKIDERHLILLDLSDKLVLDVKRICPQYLAEANSRLVFSQFFIMDRIALSGESKKYKVLIKNIRSTLKEIHFLSNNYIGKPLKIKAMAFIVSLPIYKLLLKLNILLKRGK